MPTASLSKRSSVLQKGLRVKPRLPLERADFSPGKNRPFVPGRRQTPGKNHSCALPPSICTLR